MLVSVKRMPSTNAMLVVTAAAVLAVLLGEPIQQWVWSLLGCGLLIAAATDLIRQGVER